MLVFSAKLAIAAPIFSSWPSITHDRRAAILANAPVLCSAILKYCVSVGMREWDLCQRISQA